MDLDKIKRQLRGILAKANDGSGATDAEAMNALEFAQRMMMRHQLTESDLGGTERTAHEIAADTEYAETVIYSMGVNLSQWQINLGLAINMLVGTTQFYINGKSARRSSTGNIEFDAKGKQKEATRLVFYGPADDIHDATGMFEEWSTMIAALARMKFGGALRGPGRSYAEGFSMALFNRMREIRDRNLELIAQGGGDLASRADAALIAANEDENDACSALVVIKSTELVEAKKQGGSDWLRTNKGITLRKRGAGAGGRHHDDAFGAGQRDGKNAEFSRSTPTRKIS